MSAPSHWYESHGLHSQSEQNQAWRWGTMHQRADTPDPSASTDYSLLLSCLITTSTHPPLFMQQWYCSYSVGGCQPVKDVYLVVRVCRSEWVCVSESEKENCWCSKCLNVHSFTWLHFSGKTFCWITVKNMWFKESGFLQHQKLHKVMKERPQAILLGGYLKYQITGLF